MDPSLDSQLTPFGHEMLKKHFLLDPKYKPLNHGSFGTYPASVRTVLRSLQDENEANPDYFFRYTHEEKVDEARHTVAKYVNAPVDEVVFVKNASTGVNTTLRNLVFAPGDVIVYFSTIYGACEKTIVSVMESTPVQARKVEYEFPISHDEIVRRFVQVVRKARDEEGLNVRVAIFDAVVSVPGVRFPFEKLTRACKEEGVLSLIDGAHGVGQIPIDLGALQPDFFVSNCHKWLYTPRGCAVYYVAKRNQHLIRTSFPTSHGFVPANAGAIANPLQSDATKSAFESLFAFVATTDDNPYMCVPAAVKFRQDVCGGDTAIYTYLERIAREGSDAVAKALGTDVMQEPGLESGADSLIRRCALQNVRLPLAVADAGGHPVSGNPYLPPRSTSPYPWLDPAVTTAVKFFMEDRLLKEYNTFVMAYPHAGWMWIRLSAQIYLELEDFEWLGPVLKELCDRVAKGEYAATKANL